MTLIAEPGVPKEGKARRLSEVALRKRSGKRWAASSGGKDEVMRFVRNRSCKMLACAVLALAMFSWSSPVLADEYDPQAAGHPLRIIAYGMHPVGVVLDLLIFRPVHWIGSYEPIALFFGHEPYTR